MASSTSWRFVFTENNGDIYQISANEIELRTTVGGADVSGASTGNSKSGSSPFSAGNLIDDNSGYWLESIDTEPLPHWVQFDFGSAIDVAEYGIDGYKGTYPAGDPDKSPRAWTLEYWDGAEWVVADTIEDEDPWTEHETRLYTVDGGGGGEDPDPPEPDPPIATGAVQAKLRQTVNGGSGTASTTLQQTVNALQGITQATLRQSISATGLVSTVLRQTVNDESALDDTALHWRPVVILDGVHLTNLTGQITLDAEESVARTLEFTIEPASGPISPSDWIGQPVSVDFALTDSTGAITQQWRRFTGVVDRPVYDPVTGLVTFRCLDALVDSFNAMSHAEINSLIGGYPSDDVLDPDATGWEHVQDLLTTTPQCVFFTAAGLMRIAPWTAKASPDITFTVPDIDDETLQVELVPRRKLHNTVNLTLQYRYERLYQRFASIGWNYGRSFCDYIAEPSTLPDKGMVEQALQSSGWVIDAVSFTQLPASGVLDCSGAFTWINESELVTGFSARAARRWTQTVTEAYQITIRSAGSVAAYGKREKQKRFSMQTEFDYEAFEGVNAQNATAVNSVSSTTAAASADKTALGYSNATPVPVGSAQDDQGDYVLDKAERSASAAAIRCTVAQAMVSILDAHRQNTVEFETLLQPRMELDMTARVETDRVTAQGKVIQIIETMNVDSGEASSRVRIAISRGDDAGTGVVNPIIPDPPASYAETAEQSLNGTGLPTHLGGKIGVPGFDDEWTGYIGNYQIASGVITGPWEPVSVNATEIGSEVYPVKLIVPFPDIETSRRDAVEAEQDTSQPVSIPTDELILSF